MNATLASSLRFLAVFALLFAPNVHAVDFSGNVGPTDPTMPVVFISSPDCTGQGVSPVHYKSYPLEVGTSGLYFFFVTSSSGFASMYLFDSTFDPSAAFPSCLAADNSGNPVTFSETLVAGSQYYFVIFDDTFDQLGGTFNATVAGPGTIAIAGLLGGVPIPTLSAGGLLALATLMLAAAWMARRRLRS